MTAWPALMTRKTLACYLDMSEAAVEREVAAGRLPQGVTMGGKVHWHRQAIDAAIAAIAGTGDVPAYLQEFERRYG